MKIIYAFPEPLPVDRARGLQAVCTVAALGRAGVAVDFAYVPVFGVDPFVYYGVVRPKTVALIPLARTLPWPFSRIHSNRIFFAKLRRHFGAALSVTPLMVRHLKLAAMVADQVPGVRFLYEAHEVFGDTAKGAKRDINRGLERRVIAQAAALVANSGATARRLRELYPQGVAINVVPNGVDIPERLPDKPWHNAGLNIVYAGSFFPWKGAADLIQAASGLPGTRITMIGGEPQRISELRRSVGAGGAEVIFAGHLPHSEVMSRLAGACITVLPNRNDTDSAFTSPIKLFEYMASGCAIVASDLPSLREILDEDEAVWFRPGDTIDLARVLGRIAGSPERAAQLGAAVRAKSMHFSWDARARKLISVLGKD